MWKQILIAAVLAEFIGSSLATAAPPATSAAAAGPLPAATMRMINVGGRRVAFHVIPGRQPAVVFEAGGGMDGTAWAPVLATIYAATGAELITFDRAGFGDSDEDTRPPTIQHEVDDLRTGLSVLNADHDIVLVAHSYGGEIATAFINQNPKAVVRAVLVDASIPSFFTDAETAQMTSTFPKTMPQTDKQSRTMVAFFKAFPDIQHGFHAMHWSDTVPATVIVSEHPPLLTPAENVLWTQDHVDFAHAAANRNIVIAKGSGHIVMTDRPDIVSQAVVSAIDQIRQTAQH